MLSFMSDLYKVKTKTLRNALIIVLLIIGSVAGYYFTSMYLDYEVNVRKDRIVDLHRELSVVESNLRRNLTLIENLNSEIEHVNATVTSLDSENPTLITQKAQLETQVDSLNKQVGDILAEILRLSYILNGLGYTP